MKLFSWGANTYGQLGIGEKFELCIKPVEVAFPCNPETICTIAGGGGHTLICDLNGNVYSSGWNSRGQLGHSNLSEETTFKAVETIADHKVITVCCGWDSSYALTVDGKLFGWGANLYGQLGISKKKLLYESRPLQLMDNNVHQVSSGLRHTALVTSNGGLFISGSGRKCQLGLVNCGEAVNESYKFQQVPALPAIQMVACGQHHTVALTVSGKILVWGDNRFGQLGVDPVLVSNASTPMEINVYHEQFSKDCTIFCGWTHTVIKTGDGKIINWGRNNYGQLGSEESKRNKPWNPQVLENIPSVKQIRVGSEHNLAVLDDTRIFSWGWNEHGNCGTGSDENVKNPTSVEINGCWDNTVLGGVGAGHSFAVVST